MCQLLTFPLDAHCTGRADSKLQPIYNRQATLLKELLAEVDAASMVVDVEADIEVPEPGGAHVLRTENVGTCCFQSMCLVPVPAANPNVTSAAATVADCHRWRF